MCVSLTFAGVGEPAVVEAGHTGITAAPPRVVHTLQAFAGAPVAASRHSDVDVAAALAWPAGTLHTSSP